MFTLLMPSQPGDVVRLIEVIFARSRLDADGLLCVLTFFPLPAQPFAASSCTVITIMLRADVTTMHASRLDRPLLRSASLQVKPALPSRCTAQPAV